MKILITGDRNWTDEETIKYELLKYDPYNTTIIEGGARGADTIAHNIAFELGFKTLIREFAHWNHTAKCPKDCKLIIGRAAGAIRNKKMLDTYKPDLVLAFHTDIKSSKGTKHMIQYAKKNNVDVILIEKYLDQYEFDFPLVADGHITATTILGKLPEPEWEY